MTSSMLLLVILLGTTLMLTRGDLVDDLFTEYDQNGDGLISPSEIDSQLDAGIVTINNYVATFDGDNDGKLNPSEFANFAGFANL